MSAIRQQMWPPSALVFAISSSTTSKNARRFMEPVSGSMLASSFSSSFCASIFRRDSSSWESVRSSSTFLRSSSVTSFSDTRHPRTAPRPSVIGLAASLALRWPSGVCVNSSISPATVTPSRIATVQGWSSGSRSPSEARSHGISEALRADRPTLSSGPFSSRNASFASTMRPLVSSTITPSVSVSSALRTRSGIALVGSRCSSTRRMYQ